MSGKTVTIDREDMASMRKVWAALGKESREAEKVISRSINKTLAGVRTDMTEIVAKDLNLPKKHIRDNIKMKKATYADLVGVTWRSGKPVPLALFTGTRQGARGVSVKVKKTGQRATLKHAFITSVFGRWKSQTEEEGHRGVFWRRGDYVGKGANKYTTEQARRMFSRRVMPSRYRVPIDELTGPRVEDILSAELHIVDLTAKAGNRLVKNMEHELEVVLKGIA